MRRGVILGREHDLEVGALRILLLVLSPGEEGEEEEEAEEGDLAMLGTEA